MTARFVISSNFRKKRRITHVMGYTYLFCTKSVFHSSRKKKHRKNLEETTPATLNTNPQQLRIKGKGEKTLEDPEVKLHYLLQFTVFCDLQNVT